jgi:excisionase family DNA binding protein
MYSMTELLDRALACRPSAAEHQSFRDHLRPKYKYFNVPKMIGPIDPDDILTPEEVAARLKVPESWVYEKTRARCRNPMPCLRLGRYVRFDWNAVISWLTAGAAQEPHAARPSLQKKR